MNNEDARPEKDKLLMENSLAFFGAITASVSHELNNVISIVNQTAGLLDDLLIGAREGRAIKNERLERMAESVKNQTERGIGIIRRLNKFAHSADEAIREYDLSEMTENLVALTRRLTNLKKAELEMIPASGPISVVGSPFLVQQALFLSIRLSLSAVQENDTIRVEINEQGADLKLLISGIRPGPDAEYDMSYLEILTASYGGTVEIRRDAELMTFEIIVPRGK